MRIMKSRKDMEHNALIAEVTTEADPLDPTTHESPAPSAPTCVGIRGESLPPAFSSGSPEFR